jgi:hypothetical protein
MSSDLLTLSKRPILKPYQARTFKTYEFMTDAEIMQHQGGTLSVDTESYLNFFLICMKHIETGKVIKFEINGITGECINERKLSWIMHSYTTVGFNSYKFDCPLIWLSYAQQSLAVLKGAVEYLINQNYHQSSFEKEYNVKVHPTNHIDLIEVCPGVHSLKLYMARLHSTRIQDLPFNPNGALTDEQCEIVTDYCINDLDGTNQLYLFNKERIELREYLGREYKVDLRSKSDAQMAEAIISKEIYKKTHQWPKKATIDAGTIYKYQCPQYLRFATPQFQKLLSDVLAADYIVNEFGKIDTPKLFKSRYVGINKFQCKFGIGGLHSCETNVSYVADENYLIVDRDVASYYPRIITNLGLYPDHLGSVFLDAYEQIITNRLEAKRTKQFTKDKGLKIAINGTSGKFNSEYSIVYSPRCYIQMTLTGQLSILMLVEMLECNGISIISANTDGIVIHCRKEDYEKLNYWIKFWEDATNFVTEETQYRAYYARDVNAYFAVKLDGSVKVKGPYSEVGSQTGTKLDNNPIHLICSDAVKALLSKGIPIEKTIRDCKDLTRFVVARNVTGGAHKDGHYLGKTIRWYYAKGCGGTINAVKSGNKIPETDGAKPCMDLPGQFPDDIDYQRYLAIAKEILFEINYLKRAKQISFF